MRQNMELQIYLLKNKITKTECAKTLGISRNQLYLILNGKSGCTRKMAMRIQEFTKGQTSAWEMMGLELPNEESSLKGAQKTAIDLLEELGLLKTFDHEKVTDKIQRHYMKKKLESRPAS
jgi:plasmid maintenance system antidote protein VapI